MLFILSLYFTPLRMALGIGEAATEEVITTTRFILFCGITYTLLLEGIVITVVKIVKKIIEKIKNR